MKRNLLLGVALASVVFFSNCGNNRQTKGPDSTEMANEQNEEKHDDHEHTENAADFLVKVADGNMLEVEMGRLAQKNGQMQDVKDFGAMMVEHHGKALSEMKTLAASKNISLPESLSDDSRKKLEDMAKKTGRDFDKAYIDEMESDHEKDVRKFEDKSDDTDIDADVKEWVIRTLPTLQNHLTEIKRIEDKFDAMKK